MGCQRLKGCSDETAEGIIMAELQLLSAGHVKKHHPYCKAESIYLKKKKVINIHEGCLTSRISNKKQKLIDYCRWNQPIAVCVLIYHRLATRQVVGYGRSVGVPCDEIKRGHGQMNQLATWS